MRFADLVFVTSNLNKLREAEAVLGIKLDHRALEIAELQSLSLEEVVRAKASCAWERLRAPVLVEDTSLELVGLGGFPGPLIRWMLASVGPAGICRIAHAFADPRAIARCMVTATDGGDEVVGMGEVRGRIAEAPRGGRGFGWDSAFVPDGHRGRTFSELSSAEKNAISHRRKAFEALRDALRERGALRT
jgi:non-canonical purine NTP pyrophosphatase (RdgB/HAM1 family)